VRERSEVFKFTKHAKLFSKCFDKFYCVIIKVSTKRAKISLRTYLSAVLPTG